MSFRRKKWSQIFIFLPIIPEQDDIDRSFILYIITIYIDSKYLTKYHANTNEGRQPLYYSAITFSRDKKKACLFTLTLSLLNTWMLCTYSMCYIYKKCTTVNFNGHFIVFYHKDVDIYDINTIFAKGVKRYLLKLC